MPESLRRGQSMYNPAPLLLLLALAPSTTEAAPEKKSALVSEAREPKGLRLRWFSYTGKPVPPESEPTQLWLWRASKAELLGRLGNKKPICLPVPRLDGVEHCHFGSLDAGAWYADFGDDFFEVDVNFFKGEFYSYSVDFPEEKFEYVKRTLAAALGKAGLSRFSTVNNHYGTKFEKETVTWASNRVAIFLEQRSSTVDEGEMRVVFLPIAKLTPEPSSGKAPF